MMKRLFYLFIFIYSLSSSDLSSQGTGTWKSYMSYYTTTAVAEANNNVFAVANSSLYSYNTDDNSYKTYSKEDNELSDTQIDTIAYNQNAKTLLIVYTNGNMDLLSEEGIYNIPFLMQITLPDKQINHIYFQDKFAYISAAFGIMVLNMEKREITDTYRIGYPTYSTCILDNHIYAATSKGILRASLSDNLLDPKNWNPYLIELNDGSTDGTEGNIYRIVVFQDKLTLLINKKGIYVQNQGNAFNSLLSNTDIRDLSVQNNKLIFFTVNRGYVYFSLTESHILPSFPNGQLYGISTLKDNTYWMASGTEMLCGSRRKGNTSEYEWFVHGIRIDSPKRDYAANMIFNNGKLWVAGGGRWTDAFLRLGTVMVYNPASDSTQWFNLNEWSVINQAPGRRFYDATSIAVHPEDPNHYFVSSWGDGVFEFKNNEFVKAYHTTNSTLESATGNTYTYIRVDGLCFDKDNNLWMTNSGGLDSGAGVKNAIKKMTSEGKWDYLYFKQLERQHIVDKILFTSAGHKWVNVLRGRASGDAGILVFDETSDKPAQFYSSFPTKSTADEIISANTYYCMVEDHKGQVWMGTNLGPIYCATPSNALNNRDGLIVNRVVRYDEYDNPSLFMDGESVQAIAVDGANRKWLGTASSGILLISEDGLETIEHFKTDNSPLPSNNIESIAINHETGEVFIGTDKGIVSYMGSATTGKESYSDVYAFPNPVRPEYQGDVTITGLMVDSNIKITDINGNLIKQGKSFGGQYVWDCRKRNGERVATGIYLVMASEPNKGESVVTKIMVVK